MTTTLRNTEPRVHLLSPTMNPLATLPPPELRQMFPALDAACNEVERLRAERGEVKRALAAATSERRGAEAADIRAAAQSHRSGKGDPGSPAAEAVDAEIRDLTRREAILSTAMDTAAADLAGVIEQHRAEWSLKTTTKAAKRRGDLRAAAMTWGDLRHEVAGLESLQRWLTGFASRPSYSAPTRYMNSSGPEGTRVDTGKRWDVTLEELLTDADGPMAAVAGGIELPDEAA